MSPSLRLEGLRVRLSPRFEAGPLTAVLGPGITRLHGANGTGKTTLLRAICGEIPATAGRIEVRSAVATGDPQRAPGVRRAIGFVSTRLDVPEFFSVDEAWQNLAAIRGCPTWSGGALRDALHLPRGLRLAHGSAGQRRRIELLCGLVGDPPILLLDEPFAHLDDQGCTWLTAQLERWRTDRVVVLTAHGEPPVQVDRSLHLDSGVESGVGLR